MTVFEMNVERRQANVDSLVAVLLQKPGKPHRACTKWYWLGIRTWSKIIRKATKPYDYEDFGHTSDRQLLFPGGGIFYVFPEDIAF